MNVRTLHDFLSMLVAIRISSVLLSGAAREAYYWDGGRVTGFLSGLRAAGVIDFDEEKRMYGLFCNAAEHSGQPFPSRLNVGPCIWPWDLRERHQQAREETADAPVEVPAPPTPRGLRLLCLLVKTRTGETRSLPVHTLYRVPPYAGIRGRYHDGAGRWSVAFDPLDVPGGAGFYLRETHARTPSPEVLARCLRQRQAHALRAHSPAVRVGGLSRV